MIDIPFKMYYSFLMSKGEKGAEAAVIGLASILTFNLHLVILLLTSLFIPIRDLGIFFFMTTLGVLIVFNLISLK